MKFTLEMNDLDYERLAAILRHAGTLLGEKMEALHVDDGSLYGDTSDGDMYLELESRQAMLYRVTKALETQAYDQYDEALGKEERTRLPWRLPGTELL